MNKKLPVLLLMIAGAVFFAIAFASISRSLGLKKNGIMTEGTVVDKSSGKGLSTVTIEFNTNDGNQITAKASKRYRVAKGEKTKVYYDPANPQKIDFGDTVGYNMRGVLAGGLFFIIGLYYFIRFSLSDRLKAKLLKTGQKITADFAVERNEKYRMGDNNPWIIKCKWLDSRNNQEYSFTSKDYTIDPAPYLKNRNSIDVFIDPSDPGKYYMDTSFMPKGNNTIG
jgi:cytochrome c oxidase assembly protein Cox11